eukprot:c28611_g1_i6 orf=828-2165(-)
MARTYAAVEVDKDAQPRGWRLVLCTFQEVKLYRKLRKGGLFGGFGSVDELKARCLQLATLPITIEASQNEKLVEKPEDPWHELASCAVATSENLNCRDCGDGLTQQKHLLDRKVSQISCGCSERHISVVPEFTIAEDCDLQVHETCNDGFAEEDIKCMVRNLIKTSQQYVQAQHKHSERNSVATSLLPAVTKLRSIIHAACVALRILDGGGSFMEAEQICPKQLLREFERNMAQLGTYDVNQYFPSVNKKMEVAEKINCYVQDGDTLVVVSGWENDFFMHVKERLSRSGKRCDYISYILSETNKVAALKEWFKKEKEDMPTGSNLVVCVSPHFELCGQNVDVLFELVLELKAKLLALILPFTAERLKRERSYDLIWEDKHFLQGEVLWPWGLMDFPESSFNHRNGISPSMYLWSRSDWTVKHRQVACQFGHIPKQTLESKVHLFF